MATSSFDKQFIIDDLQVAKDFLDYLDDPNTPKIKVNKKNLDEENKSGILKLLKRKQ
ncbi:MAG: hypothetical protein U0354_20790 [Candidatus Sericytochromatia bacterium]